MTITANFGGAAGGLGYRRSERALPNAMDYMSVSYLAPSPTQELFHAVSARPMMSDPYCAAPQNGTGETLFPEIQDDRTVFQQLNEGTNVDYSVNIDTQSMMRSADKKIEDGAIVGDKRVMGQAEVEDKKNQMTEQWDSAKEQAIACLKEAASLQDLDPDDVVGQIVPSETTTGKLGAGIAIGADAATAGLGSFANVAGKAAFVATEVGKAEKQNLSRDQIKSLIADATRIAQSGGAQDTRASASVSGGGAKDVADTKPKADISKLNERGMEQLLTQNLEDQKEFKALDMTEKNLDIVENNHVKAAREYADTNLLEKGEVLAKTGRDEYVTEMFDQATVAMDSGDALVVSSSMKSMAFSQGIGFVCGLAANDADFVVSAPEITTKIDQKQISMPELAFRVQQDMAQQLRV